MELGIRSGAGHTHGAVSSDCLVRMPVHDSDIEPDPRVSLDDEPRPVKRRSGHALSRPGHYPIAPLVAPTGGNQPEVARAVRAELTPVAEPTGGD
jgi:hypothetical protein